MWVAGAGAQSYDPHVGDIRHLYRPPPQYQLLESVPEVLQRQHGHRARQAWLRCCKFLLIDLCQFGVAAPVFHVVYVLVI